MQSHEDTDEPPTTAEAPDSGAQIPCAATVDDDIDNATHEPDAAEAGASPRPFMNRVGAAGAVVVVVLAAIVSWLGFGAYRTHQTNEQREEFVQVARQGALNLSTIDWQKADADVQRILDSATGTFHDDFDSKKVPFIDIVKKSQSTSVGTISEAGLESESADAAQVMVAVSVKTTNAQAKDQPPRRWRMRISVQKSGDDVKVSKVDFVP